MILPGLQWTTPERLLVGQLYELDMTEAGMTVIALDRLLPDGDIAWLRSLPKADRSPAVGRISRDRPDLRLSAKVTEGIKRRMEEILQVNAVQPDNIVSVKRDAVILCNVQPSTLRLKDGTQFKVKGSFSCFAKFGQVEFYAVPSRGLWDIRGIAKEKRGLHEAGCVRIILDMLRMIERGQRGDAAATLAQFRRDYLARRLPIAFYREFNADSAYALRVEGEVFKLPGGAGEVPPDDLEVAYNLRNVVVPLAAMISM